MSIEIRSVPASDLYPLRLSVLRPGRAPEEAVFDGDDDPGALHLAAFAGPSIVGVASIYRRPFPLAGAPSTWGQTWQLRGMAVAPEHQRSGVGRALLDECVRHVLARSGTLWCNAREQAAGFYSAAGFEIRGERFEIPDVGPHFVMARRVEAGSST